MVFITQFLLISIFKITFAVRSTSLRATFFKALNQLVSETVSLIGLSQKVNRIVKIFDDTKYFTNLEQDIQLKTTLIFYHEWITIYLPN